MRAVSGSERRNRPALIGLAALYLFTLIALGGFATFGMNPALLARFPQFAGFYASSFDFFAQGQIWLAFLALAAFLTGRIGLKWLPAFAALYLVSLGSELLGTTVGLPFGEYYYTEALGSKWFGHVPLLIPISWFFMAVPSYALAALAGPGTRKERVLVGSFILLAWDLALDPAMSRATAYWVWENPGMYYGMPWLNLFGWYVTGVALMAVLAALNADRWIRPLSARWLAAFYGANLLLPVGMSAISGLWGAVATTTVVLGGTAVIGYLRSERVGVASSAEVTA